VTGQWAYAEMYEAPSERQQTRLSCEGDQAHVDIAQRDCGVSLLGDLQKPSGPGPGQLALGGPA